MCVLVGCLKLCSLFLIIMLQKSVAVPLLAPEPGEDAVRGPVSLPGVRPRDAVRNAHLFMRGACVPVQPSLQGADLPRDGVRVRCVRPARATGSIRPFGSGLGSLPVRGLPARGAQHRGRVETPRGAQSRGPRGAGRVGLSFLEARDQLRSFAATPLKYSRVPRVVTLPSSRASSGSGSVPVGASGTTPTSLGSSSSNPVQVEEQVLQVDFQEQNRNSFVSSLVM